VVFVVRTHLLQLLLVQLQQLFCVAFYLNNKQKLIRIHT
jgi:hypothetical protein